MSFLSFSRSRLARVTALTQQPCRMVLPASSPQSSSFHSPASRSVLKESDRHRDDLGSEIDKHNQDQINRHKEGHEKAGWVEELASSSEENVKADRGEISDPTFDKIQEEIKKHAAQGKGKKA
ncbi:hypothetical protein CIHG_02106 [Coccidioides immitis H538.4]|uniref:Uncharacterized protein n=1 Tax=Coccidioides immitis H538.4 TaxID=396776 RepID=A0A0J8RGM2_COCIT|nr:hypothetical protein CIHG_02106 [Coccidioides immitis H538.4]